VGSIAGLDAYAETMRQFFAGLPDAEAIEQDAAQDGDTLTMRFIVQGTHTGNLWGIAPTATPSPRTER
jgi:predicted ester cyclase